MTTKMDAQAFAPPHPKPLPALAALARTVWQGDGDLLSLLPSYAYETPIRFIGYSRRQILIVNDPALVRRVMVEETELFPKSDLMVGALEPLVGDSLFVSGGEVWRRQRRIIDPSFSQLRVDAAFSDMDAAVSAYEARLARYAQTNETFSLDLAMSHLTADIICRTVFSTSLESNTAHEVFEDFMRFERAVAHVELKRLIFGRAWAPAPQNPDVLAACARIRGHIGDLLDPHLNADGGANIAASVANAVDPETNTRFSREELIDQLGVFFLAGHETTASALTWVFYILGREAGVAARLREEVDQAEADGPLDSAAVKRLSYARNVFKEALRLYPPITFVPRVAARPCQLGQYKLRRGAMVMVAPW
ncbi:MAG: cytochrome P450, partial [Pseudomonadota bacterium]